MDLGITGKRAAVSGASTGLGFACAQALIAEGVRVAICSRDQDRVEAAAERLGHDTVALQADVSRPEEARRFVTEAAAALGSIDILVPNAGGPPPGKPSSTELDAYRHALDLNLLATVALCNAAVGPMRERGWGRICAITSGGARSPIPFLAASSVARAGVTSFLKTLATEVAGDGVTVNSAQPGLHSTDRLTELGDPSSMAKSVPAGFLGSPEDFGKAVTFLCSEPAKFITGTSLLLDGGSYPGLV
ncbi:MAG: SDR family oxidoreductase [Acidobacteriota bacterium]